MPVFCGEIRRRIEEQSPVFMFSKRASAKICHDVLSSFQGKEFLRTTITTSEQYNWYMQIISFSLSLDFNDYSMELTEASMVIIHYFLDYRPGRSIIEKNNIMKMTFVCLWYLFRNASAKAFIPSVIGSINKLINDSSYQINQELWDVLGLFFDDVICFEHMDSFKESLFPIVLTVLQNRSYSGSMIHYHLSQLYYISLIKNNCVNYWDKFISQIFFDFWTSSLNNICSQDRVIKMFLSLQSIIPPAAFFITTINCLDEILAQKSNFVLPNWPSDFILNIYGDTLRQIDHMPQRIALFLVFKYGNIPENSFWAIKAIAAFSNHVVVSKINDLSLILDCAMSLFYRYKSSMKDCCQVLIDKIQTYSEIQLGNNFLKYSCFLLSVIQAYHGSIKLPDHKSYISNFFAHNCPQYTYSLVYQWILSSISDNLYSLHSGFRPSNNPDVINQLLILIERKNSSIQSLYDTFFNEFSCIFRNCSIKMIMTMIFMFLSVPPPEHVKRKINDIIDELDSNYKIESLIGVLKLAVNLTPVSILTTNEIRSLNQGIYSHYQVNSYVLSFGESPEGYLILVFRTIMGAFAYKIKDMHRRSHDSIDQQALAILTDIGLVNEKVSLRRINAVTFQQIHYVDSISIPAQFDIGLYRVSKASKSLFSCKKSSKTADRFLRFLDSDKTSYTSNDINMTEVPSLTTAIALFRIVPTYLFEVFNNESSLSTFSFLLILNESNHRINIGHTNIPSIVLSPDFSGYNVKFDTENEHIELFIHSSSIRSFLITLFHKYLLDNQPHSFLKCYCDKIESNESVIDYLPPSTEEFVSQCL